MMVWLLHMYDGSSCMTKHKDDSRLASGLATGTTGYQTLN
jgi:hypothetical protein